MAYRAGNQSGASGHSAGNVRLWAGHGAEQRRRALSAIVWAAVALIAIAAARTSYAQYADKPIHVTAEDRQRAMRERPLLFGATIIWDGRSVVYELPEKFNAVMQERVLRAGVTATTVGLPWAAIEPEPQEYHWEEVEKQVGLQRLLDMHIEPIAIVSTAPGWATASGTAGMEQPTEEAAELFEAFVRAMATRYRGRIRHYQFWSGQDVTGWQPSVDPAAYARWLRRFYESVKAADPQCRVSTGGHLGRDTGFLEAVYKAGGGAHLDAVAILPWVPREHPQGARSFDWKMVEDYRAVMVRHGDEGKSIWCTEYGWDVTDVGPANQARYVRESLDYLVSYPFVTVGVMQAMADWHRGNQGLFGLCDKDLTPRPAYDAWVEYVRPLRAAASRPGPAGGADASATQPTTRSTTQPATRPAK